MSTFVNLGLDSLNVRLAEIDLILLEAKNTTSTNPKLYSALCRSVQVLLLAHFEGYTKDLVKNSLDDINKFSSFKASNPALKKVFCQHFVIIDAEDKNSKAAHAKIKEFIEFLDTLDTKFDKNYFSYKDNENPKISVLNKIASQYGIENFFKQLKQSCLDLVFSNTNSENISMRDSLKEYLLKATITYPYDVDLKFIEIDKDKSTDDELWDTFISNLLKRRHDIAHGREIENSVDASVIENEKIMLEIVLYAFTLFICVNSNPVKTNI